MQFGFISTTVGSSCELMALSSKAHRLSQSGYLQVFALRSYEHVGVLNVTLFSGPARDSQCILDAPRQVLGSMTLDCHWPFNVSEAGKVALKYKIPTPVETTCLYVRLGVAESGRKHNKVKVLSISFISL